MSETRTTVELGEMEGGFVPFEDRLWISEEFVAKWRGGEAPGPLNQCWDIFLINGGGLFMLEALEKATWRRMTERDWERFCGVHQEK